MTQTQAATTDQIIARHDQFMTLNYPRFPVALVRGEGSRVWDASGRMYLDLFAGFGAPVLGHCHPDLVAAVTEQAGALWHVGNLFHTEPQTRVAEAISRLGFGGRSFFCHAGADANEAALKLARLYGYFHPGGAGQRYKIISATRSFHGRSLGTMPATGNDKVREHFGPMLPGYVNVAYDDVGAIEAEVDELAVAVIVEPIQGEGGVHVPAPDYFKQVRALCDAHDMLLIADEVWTGCGRTGRYFGHQHWGVTPDIMTLGKGVGGGLAVGVMCAAPKAAELYDAGKHGVKHATTLGGNCLAMAAAATVFHVLERDGLVERAAELGEHTVRRWKAFGDRHGLVKDVRGRGLFIGIELDTEAPGAWFDSGAAVVGKALDAGLIINATQGNVVRVAPALTIERDLLDEGFDRLEGVLLGNGAPHA